MKKKKLDEGYRIPKHDHRDPKPRERDYAPRHREDGPRPGGQQGSSDGQGGHGRGRGKHGGRGGGNTGGGGNRGRGPSKSNNNRDRENDQDGGGGKSEYFSPKSFLEAWNTCFFSPTAILYLTTIGLLTDSLPFLHGLLIGGRLAYCVKAWKLVANNNWVVNVVRFGYKMPLRSKPYQTRPPKNPTVAADAHQVLVTEADGLLAKGAVHVVEPEDGQFLSSYFAVPKPRSTKWRPILNLKYFNEHVRHYKFRMETFVQVREWIQPGSYLIGIDLKDQFLSVPVARKFRKYLRFSWLGKLLEWRVIPFGLKCSPRVVTKLLKPVLAFLRVTWGIMISIYMDDMILQAPTAQEVYFHAQLTILVLLCLGWEVNWEKTSLTPSHNLTHLGFDIDTLSMTASCPMKKVDILREAAKTALKEGKISVHCAEKLLGRMESVRPVTPLAALHYRALQKQLLSAKRCQRNPKQMIVLSQKSIQNLLWWVSDTGFLCNRTAPLREPVPTLHIWSDASMVGAGAHSSRGGMMQRTWTEEELSEDPHINLLEVRAGKEAVDVLAEEGDRVRLRIDNTTAVSYISKQGGTRSGPLSKEACELWTLAEERNITLLTPHWISTHDNVGADLLSRTKLDVWEVKLDEDLFQLVVDHFKVTPTLDAFASCKTRQLPRYMSWREDKEAVGRDALMCRWDAVTWLFPPVPLLTKVINKVKEDRITAVLICPHWPTSLWWLLLKDLLVAPPLPLPPYKLSTRNMEGGPVGVYLDPLQALLLSCSNMQ